MINSCPPHCGTPTYLSDTYCPICGDTLDEKRALNNVQDLYPDAFNRLKAHYPNAQLITGQITKTHFYKRTKHTKNNTNSCALWFLTVESTDGIQYRFNVDAENKILVNLKVGDVITFAEPYAVKVPMARDNNTPDAITNDILLDAVVLHTGEGQFLQHVGIHQPINPIEKIITYYFFALLFAVILGGFITLAPHGLNFFKGNFWISVLLIGAPAWYFCHRKHREFSQVFEDEKRVYQSFLDILPLMQGVSLTDLGYHQKVRPKGNDDILCDYCDHRLSTQAHYCPHCGKSQHNNETDVDTVIVDAMVASHDGELGAESALMTAPSGENVVTTENIVMAHAATATLAVEPSVTVKPRRTVMDVIHAKMAEFRYDHEDKIIYRHALVPNEELKVTAWCYMARVIEREASVDINRTSVTTTTTRTDRYGDKDTSISTHHTRDVSFNSKLLMRTELGHEFELWLPEKMRSYTDVGDILMVEGVKLEDKSGKSHYYNPHYLNMTKKRYNREGSNLGSYRNKPILPQLIQLSLALICLWGFIEIEPQMLAIFHQWAWSSALINHLGNTIFTALLTFVPYMLFCIVIKWLDSRSRDWYKNEAIRIYQPVWALRDKALDDIDELHDLFTKLN